MKIVSMGTSDSKLSVARRRSRYSADKLLDPHQTITNRMWRAPVPFNQGSGSECVGFAWAHALASEPINCTWVTEDFAVRQIYQPAKGLDGLHGDERRIALHQKWGTTVVAGAQVLKALGLIKHYYRCESVQSLLLTVVQNGPVVLGCRWYRQFDYPDTFGRMLPEGPLIGRHCVLVTGIKVDVPGDDILVSILNSRGSSWGTDGIGLLDARTIETIWNDAEAYIGLA